MTLQYKKIISGLVFAITGSISTAQITPTTSTAPQLPLPPVPTAYNTAMPVNYVRTWEARKAVSDVSAAALGNNANYKTATAYFDGLGRPLQTVVNGNNYDGTMDIVSMNVYDGYGREVQQYLPYAPATGSNGKFRPNAFAEQQVYYNTNYQDQTPFGKTDYEASPLNRPLKTYAPGNSWAGNNIGVSVQNLVNTLDDDVKMISIAATPGAMPVFGTAYPAGSLYKTVNTDEAGNQTVEYKDKEGKVILKKVQEATAPGTSYTGWLCTYYVYDDFDRLAMVLPPKAVAQLPTNGWQLPGGMTVGGMADELCFKYEYDNDDRVTLKKVPGAAAVYMCYDKRDRLTYVQDGNMRGAGNWMVTLYDELNRPIGTALYATAQAQAQLQTGLDNIATDNPVPVLPESSLTRLSITYHDDYTMPGTAAYNGSYVGTAQANISTGDETPDVLGKTNITRGMVTGSQTRVLDPTNQLGAGTFLSSTIYYDTKGRALQTHTTNHKGGTDVNTVVYSFTGKPLSAVQVHGNPAAVLAGTQSITVCTRSTYNNDYLLKTEKKINNSSWKRLGQMEYDAMGRPKKKWMGDPSSNFYVNMDYNIRGWLTGINKAEHNALENGSSTGFYNAIFSEVLSYDYGFTKVQVNGNIAGVKWAAAGDKQPRAYGYDYDNLNRLAIADFTQKATSSWDVSAGIDYSVNNLGYDENGNIKTMNQKGWKLGGSNFIDQLGYSYLPNSNKLKAVTDGSNDNTSKLGDFKYDVATKGATDYMYDLNGNLVMDNNKNISGIQYNHLNLPQHIEVKRNVGAISVISTIDYTYDAGGNKLQKKVTDNFADPVKVTVTDYIGGAVYENNQLQFVGHEEGRVRYAKQYYLNGDSAYNWQWDYFYKDHLGNVRSTVTEQRDTARYAAGFEESQRPKEATLFANIYETAFPISNINKTGLSTSCEDCILPPTGTNYPTDNTTVPNAYTSRLNGQGKRIGAAITLKVMAGDKVDLGTKVWYPQSAAEGNWENVEPEDVLPSLVNTLGSQAAGLSGGKTTPGELAGTSSPLLGGIGSFLDSHPESPDDENEPRAYLNWLLLDEQFNYVPNGSGFIRVPGFDDNMQTLAQQALPIVKSGYLFVYLSNETNKRDVFFDNLTVQHYTGPLTEETQYYPFGLAMAGICSRAHGRISNRKLYNGNELQEKEFGDGSGLDFYDFNARGYDQQLGRFMQIDPLSDEEGQESWTPYHFTYNNPVMFTDADGKIPIPLIIGAAVWAWRAYKVYRTVQAVRTVANSVKTGVAVAPVGSSIGSLGGKLALILPVTKKGPKDLVEEAKAAQAKEAASKERAAKRAAQSKEGAEKQGQSNQEVMGDHNTNKSKSNNDKHAKRIARAKREQAAANAKKEADKKKGN